MQRRLERQPTAMTLRRRTIEHVFGILKHWMRTTHFLTRGLEHVGTQMSLHVRLITSSVWILGIAKTIEAMRMAAS